MPPIAPSGLSFSAFPPPRCPATRLFRIDIHTHMMPSSLPDLASLTPTGGPVYPWPSFRPVPDSDSVDMYVGSTFFRRVHANCYSPATRVQEMDESGVDVQVLSTVPVLFCYDAPIEPAVVLTRALNDHLASVCAEHPNRFVWLGTLPMQSPGAAEAELRRVVALGANGVQIGVTGLCYDHPPIPE